MKEPYICLDCRTCAPLDIHGRCATCGSEAVCLVEPGRERAKYEVETLEKLWQR